MNLQFLRADESDISVIFAQVKTLIDTYEDVSSIDYDHVMNWVSRKITKCITEYRCVLLDGRKCAYYRLCDDGELDDLYVLPEYRSRGIGTEILQKCIADTQAPIYLYVFSRNLRAIAFYERFGFSVRESVCNTRLIMVRNG